VLGQRGAAVVVVLVLASCGSGRSASESTTSPTVPTTATVTPPTTLSSMVPTTVVTTVGVTSAPTSDPGPSPDPTSWDVVGISPEAGPGKVSMFAPSPDGLVCVGVRDASSDATLTDACGDWSDWYAVQLVASRLYVTGVRTAAASFVVRDTVRTINVQPLATHFAGFVFAVELGPDADLVSVDNAVNTSRCPYRLIIAAVRASGFVGEDVPIGIEKCLSSTAGIELRMNHQLDQGGLGVLDRTTGVWRLLTVGGAVCDFQGEPSTTSQEFGRLRSACDRLGWTFAPTTTS
jgi:hypothetical protein